MDWLVKLLTAESIAHTLIILGIVIGLGLVIGQIKVFKIGLGIAGVLFSGLLISYLGFSIGNQEILQFIREFGLLLFVYSIGLQVGPGFLSALYSHGLKLNILAAIIVILGVLVTVAIHFGADIPMSVAVGLFSGGTTNTPSLAAAQQTLLNMPGAPANIGDLTATGYALTYPFGIMGIIITMLLVKFVFRIDPVRESEIFTEVQAGKNDLPVYEDMDIQNPGLDGLTLGSITALQDAGALVTRIRQGQQIHVAKADTILRTGDSIRVVASKEKMNDLRLFIGCISQHNLHEETRIIAREVPVTQKNLHGKTIEQLQKQFNVIISRVCRTGGVAFIPKGGLRLHFADQLTIVGTANDIQLLTESIGNSPEALNHPDVLPIFIGIILGVILGSIPIPIGATPIKLGLAGGPLLVAIILGAKGSIGPLSWYLPKSANLVLREVGIVLFLAAVGLSAGPKFFHALSAGNGFYWMGLAVLITLIPLVVVGIIARVFFKMNFMTLCGLLSGSMTDPPALAFANTIATSTAPSIAYATVYPLVMIMRILSAQILVQLFTTGQDFLLK